MSTKVYRTWSQFKSLIDVNGWFQWNFTELADRYDLFGIQGMVIYSCTILKDGGADHVQFDATYKNNPTLNFVQWVESKLFGRKSNGSYIPIKVLDDGQLPIVASVPGSPIGSTPIKFIADGVVNNNETNNQYYTVTNGKTLTLQRFVAAGGGGITNGWEMTLYLDPSGVGNATDPVQPSWQLVSLAFIPDVGGNFFEDITPTTIVGDGTKRVVLRRVRLSGGGSKRGFAKFTGYEE